MSTQFLTLIFVSLLISASIHAAPGDSDSDGLRDEVETDTGIYVSPENTGTNPNLADSDGDSLPDGMEVHLGTNPTNAASKITRPNIIYIVADDLGYGDVSCFWKKQRTGNGMENVVTPGLDAMAAQGAMLTHHYAAAPICASSRASFLLGQHQGHAEIRNYQFDKALPDGLNIASVLKRAGYRTIHVGKAGLAGTFSNPLESSSSLPAHPLKRGFDRFFGYLRHNDGHEHYPRNGTASRLAVIHDDYSPVVDAHVDLFTSDAWTAFAKKTIIEETNSHPQRPFFLYLSYDTPHFYGETAPSAEYPAGKGLNGGIQWTGAPSYANTAVNDPTRVDNPANRHASTSTTWYQTWQKYISMIRRMDDSVTDILQTLRDLGIDQNTLVVFTSDNGPADTEVSPGIFQSYAGFEGIKTDLWEGGIRVPTIAWWPGRIPATNQLSDIRRISRPCANYDWLATLAELARAPIPSSSDGTSLVPALTGQGTQSERGYLYFEFYYRGFTSAYPEFPNHGNTIKNEMQAIRIGDYKGVRYNITSPDDPFLIYDVVNDPKESINLAPNRPDLVERINYLSVAARRKGGEAFRPYDTALIPAIQRPSVKNGIHWKAYEGYWPWLPEFRDLTPTATGTATDLSPDLRSRANDAGLCFEGYLSVPSSGAYTFRASSDSGTSLWLGEARVIDNDFNFVPQKTSAPVYLSAGLHPVRLHYRHQGGTATLELAYSGPGIPMQKIPTSAFFVDGPPPPPPDRDGDGSPDEEERVAGTDPDDAASFLRIQSIAVVNGDVILHWAAVAGRTYRIHERNAEGIWVPLANPPPLEVKISTADVSVTIPGNGASMRFFRVAASITPPSPPSDRDGDGSPDAAEQVAGTDPDDPGSFFRIHTYSKSSSGISLQWNGVAGRSYRVEESSDLSTWTLVPGMPPVVVTTATPDASITVPDNGAAKRFLRMQVKMTD